MFTKQNKIKRIIKKNIKMKRNEFEIMKGKTWLVNTVFLLKKGKKK